LIKAAWAGLVASTVLGYAGFLAAAGLHRPESIPVSICFACGLVFLGFLAARAVWFRRACDRFLRLLMSGRYDAGIGGRVWSRDEIAVLAGKFNRFAEQLKKYDELRTEKVRVTRLALKTLLQEIPEAVMLADPRKGTLELNPAMRALLGTTRGTVSVAAVEKIEQNRAFTELFRNTVTTRKTSQEGRAPLRLPAEDAERVLSFRLLPLKDKQEEARLVVVFAAAPELPDSGRRGGAA